MLKSPGNVCLTAVVCVYYVYTYTWKTQGLESKKIKQIVNDAEIARKRVFNGRCVHVYTLCIPWYIPEKVDKIGDFRQQKMLKSPGNVCLTAVVCVYYVYTYTLETPRAGWNPKK